MNQILCTESNEKKSNRKKRSVKGKEVAELSKIILFFAVSLIVYGLVTIGVTSYGIYKNKVNEEAKNEKPTIEIENKTDKTISITVKDKNAINELYYYWNDEVEKRISGNNRSTITEEIFVPSGKNTLHIRTNNNNGQETVYEGEYNRDATIDIKLESADPNIKIKVEGKTDLSYVTYKWDNDDEKTFEANGKTFEKEINVIEGEHWITVTVYDKNNDYEIVKKKIKGVGNTVKEEEKPKIIITTDGVSNFVIVATDSAGLAKMEIILNQSDKFEFDLQGKTEVKYSYPFTEGECKIEVTVYNVNGVSNEYKALVRR